MAEVPLNILSTPFQIRDLVHHIFPQAVVTSDIGQDGRNKVIVKITQIQPELILFNQVDAENFSRELTRVSNEIKKDGERERPHSLDPTWFSTALALHACERFRRILYEEHANTCWNAIAQYLIDPKEPNLTTLISLGLAPEQIEREKDEIAVTHLQKLIENLPQLEPADRAQIFPALRRAYPTVVDQILKEKAGGLVVQECKATPDLYQEFLSFLREHVVGQDFATSQTAATLTSQTVQDQNMVFLYIGPTGVGKTQLAKTVSERKKGYVEINMETYSDGASNTRLFGSPPSYVGSTDKSAFAHELDKYATSKGNDTYEVKDIVILFDEIEKAHSIVKNSLLNLLNTGKFSNTYCPGKGTENKTDRYEFKGCIFVCTSNFLSEFLLECFSHGEPEEQIRQEFSRQCRVSDSPNNFAPEFLGRVTIIPFRPIPRGEPYRQLLKGKLKVFLSQLKKEFSVKEVNVENELAVLEALENKLYEDGTNIRRVAQYFDQIKQQIYAKKASLGDLRTKKITLIVHPQQGLCLNVAVFLSELNCYVEDFCRIVLP